MEKALSANEAGDTSKAAKKAKEQEKRIENRLTEKIDALAMKIQPIGKGGKGGGQVWRGQGWQEQQDGSPAYLNHSLCQAECGERHGSLTCCPSEIQDGQGHIERPVNPRDRCMYEDQTLGIEELRLAEAIRLTRRKILFCLKDALRVWVPKAHKAKVLRLFRFRWIQPFNKIDVPHRPDKITPQPETQWKEITETEGPTPVWQEVQNLLESRRPPLPEEGAGARKSHLTRRILFSFFDKVGIPYETLA